MKILALDWTELELAFDNSDFEFDYYLDTETGQILLVTDEARRQLETLLEQDPGVGSSADFDPIPVLAQTELQEWQQQDLILAYQIEAGFGSRYLPVPKRDSRAAYQIMREFITTVEDERLAERLRQAISGRGAFRYFKDSLYEYPDEQKRWYSYEKDRLIEQIRLWLEEEDIEPSNEPGRI